MKRVLLMILTFSISTLLPAQEQCSKDCIAMIEKCAPKKAEILSLNRFLKCGNKPLLIPISDPNNKTLTTSCKVASSKAIQEIINVEQTGNNCKVSSDCIAVSMFGIPYHINKALEPATHIKLGRLVNAAAKSCPLAPMFTLRDKISLKDRIFPYHYTCEENKCIPQYDGEKFDWLAQFDKIMDIENSK